METKICLDTDISIDAFKEGIEKYQGYYTTCISLYEFLRGIEYIGKDVVVFKSSIEEYLNVLCIDNKSILTASKIYSELKKRGEIVEDPDLIIASICISNDLALYTRNKKHFERMKKFGLKLYNQ
ncbi:MAG: type II toxin-antitoxin system VapC family toxin [Sulfolobus sp.]|nr:type II toxin-antitoxin system VapC family toxin [Sulfolobus sp.]